MHEPGSLCIEDCWEPSGRLRVEVLDSGDVRVSGTSAGLIGLARMLLFLAQNGAAEGAPVSLATLGAMETGSPILELAEL